MSTLIEVHTEGVVPVTGYLALDTLVSGAAHGGLRIAADVTADRLVQAARTMTLKYGWVGLPVGGAKAGLLVSPGTSDLDRSLMLRGFGQAIRPYLKSGMYVPGEDMGSSTDDIRALLAAAGLKPSPRSLMYTASGMYTGVGVCAVGLTAAAALDLPAKDLRVVIEGFGNVGASAARHFHAAGAKIVAVSTLKGALYKESGLDVPDLLSLRRRYGDDAVLRPNVGNVVPGSSLIGLPADIFCPCAEMEGITASNAAELQARIVCPGANVPATDEAEQMLYERNVMFVPDFVANCGGVLGSSMSRAGLGREEIVDIVERRLREQMDLLIVDAREQRRTLTDMATEIAMQRFDENKAQYERKSITQSFTRLAVGVYRSGLLPRRLLAPLGRRYYGIHEP